MDYFTGGGFSVSGSAKNLLGYASPDLEPDTLAPFAVIDFETSGGSARVGRVIEVAILTVDSNGNLLEEYSTLVNPQDGNAGATFIHHISPRMLEDAPTFDEIANDITSRLLGKTLVAHNAAFEEQFLEMELKRAKSNVPQLRAIDTLQLVPRHLELPNYKLGTIAQALGFGEDEHTALGDTRLLAGIISEFRSEANLLGYPVPQTQAMPISENAKVSQRVTNLRKGSEGWMANLIPKLPVTSFSQSTFERHQYWELLGTVLEDGKITGDEIKQIAILIGKSGLSQSEVEQLNSEFLQKVKEIAAADGVITPDEKMHIDKVATSLGLL
jgi:DNA polymerase-3 subunit epsilon